MFHCPFLLHLQLPDSVRSDLINLQTRLGCIVPVLHWRESLAANTIEGDSYESHLVEQILIIGVVLPENESDEVSLDVVDVGLLQLPGLEIGIDIGIEGDPAKFLPVISLLAFDFELDLAGYLALMREDGYLIDYKDTLLMEEVSTSSMTMVSG